MRWRRLGKRLPCSSPSVLPLTEPGLSDPGVAQPLCDIQRTRRFTCHAKQPLPHWVGWTGQNSSQINAYLPCTACLLAMLPFTQKERRPPVSNIGFPTPALSTHSHILSVPFISALELNLVPFICLVANCAPVA